MCVLGLVPEQKSQVSQAGEACHLHNEGQVEQIGWPEESCSRIEIPGPISQGTPEWPWPSNEMLIRSNIESTNIYVNISIHFDECSYFDIIFTDYLERIALNK